MKKLWDNSIWCQFVGGIVALAVTGAIIFTIVHFGKQLGAAECSPVAVNSGDLGCAPKDVAKAISDARTMLLQVVGGLAGAGALFFTWRNYARSTADATATQEQARETRASENFIKAVDQLGSDKPPVRVGGLYGLGRLLRTATVEGDYWPLMEVLTSFVRLAAQKKEGQTSTGGERPEDLQAALAVLARRSHSKWPEKFNDSPVDLHGVDLSGLWLAGGHFEWGFFVGSSFVDSDLCDGYFFKADFTNADLTRAKLSRADLREAVVTSEQLLSAIGDKKTQIPPYCKRPPHWTS